MMHVHCYIGQIGAMMAYGASAEHFSILACTGIGLFAWNLLFALLPDGWESRDK